MCIDCKQCEKFCIANVLPQNVNEEELTFSASLKNEERLFYSASGGAAYGLSLAHIINGGVVYGVAYTDEYDGANYIRVSEQKDLIKLQGTKYFQASGKSKTEIFSMIENDIKQNINVLVIGLPCEIAALRLIFGMNERLILCELFCHGVTSNEVHNRYINRIKKNKKVIFFSVKSKEEGWKPNPVIKVELDDGTVNQELFYYSDYGYAFSHMSRESCYVCNWKGNQRVGDISIGDYWGIIENNEYNYKGVSIIQIHNNKGKKLLMDSQQFLDVKQVENGEAYKNNEWVNKCIPAGEHIIYKKKFITMNKNYLPVSYKTKRIVKKIIKKVIGCGYE